MLSLLKRKSMSTCYNLSVEGEHLEPTAEIELETVKSRAVKGVAALTGRTFILNVIAFVAQGFLWAFLSPEEFGVFWIVSAIVNFLVYFSDVGLAAALIQKSGQPSDEDLKTTFTVQQLLVVGLLMILFAISPFLKSHYSLTPEGYVLLWALGASFFMSSLKSIPSVLLERRLEFGKFIIPQVLETFVYNLSVVFFAWRGFGIAAFSYSVVIRGLVGLITIYILQPWKPAFHLSKKSLKELLKFGLPYQVNTLLAVLKDDGMTIILGSVLGPAGIGILGTAQRLAQYPLRFFMDNVTKVSFPAFSRMQGRKDELASAVTRSVFFISFLVFPSIVGLTVLAPLLIKAIPKYAKWEPALIPLVYLSVNTIFAAVTTQLTNMFNAVGKIKITFGLMLMWTALTFAAVPFLSWKMGVNGAGLGYMLVGISSVVAIIIARRAVHFSLWEAAIKPLAAALLMGLGIFVTKSLLSVSLFSVIILIGLGALVYGSAMYLLVGKSLIVDVKKGLSAIVSRSS